jgi:hypothetical protein
MVDAPSWRVSHEHAIQMLGEAARRRRPRKVCAEPAMPSMPQARKARAMSRFQLASKKLRRVHRVFTTS